ncbi:hypothetical protein VST7929_02897 [Vibrio stylophorae]|uniref:DUF3080 domain-containing protein n=1 Tax=Vibrio stylophorae TaxID=659351 RepID=A0ABN8DVT7_9VIBR|nr:hypothetical protein [Vibrio stylophorae]CAH0535264.1 hypothetical protein VST7929_02897 [Vibrio stylophorae]
MLRQGAFVITLLLAGCGSESQIEQVQNSSLSDQAPSIGQLFEQRVDCLEGQWDSYEDAHGDQYVRFRCQLNPNYVALVKQSELAKTAANIEKYNGHNQALIEEMQAELEYYAQVKAVMMRSLSPEASSLLSKMQMDLEQHYQHLAPPVLMVVTEQSKDAIAKGTLQTATQFCAVYDKQPAIKATCIARYFPIYQQMHQLVKRLDLSLDSPEYALIEYAIERPKHYQTAYIRALDEIENAILKTQQDIATSRDNIVKNNDIVAKFDQRFVFSQMRMTYVWQVGDDVVRPSQAFFDIKGEMGAAQFMATDMEAWLAEAAQSRADQVPVAYQIMLAGAAKTADIQPYIL